MAPAVTQSQNPPIENGQHGPHPSFIQVAKPYVFEQKLQECMAITGVTEAKEGNLRTQGVAWIDSVRKALQLPVRTYNTAVVYYHKFRLVHVDNEYSFIDAAAAALFTACKVEDTLKKSKEILCAAHNLKVAPSEQLSADDALFENHSKAIIGLERLMLEASGFDFRSRYPQKLVLKLAKLYELDRETVGKTAYNICIDIYRTFAPLKQTTSTMAIASVELATRLCDAQLELLQGEDGIDYNRWSTTRQEVIETLFDILDLYTHHRASTIIGQDHPIESFIAIRIALNGESSAHGYSRYTEEIKKKHTTNGAKATNGIKPTRENHDNREGKAKSASPILEPVSATGARGRVGERGRDGTVRFMLDPERARLEKDLVEPFFKVEEEEYEVEVERERRR
ncbi:MAG: RNA polymerase II C-terminal domain kinase beta subunit [Candelina submexicana]|nr:MAG: RNA polymerase II C-terminal domain kinase beta subunit [Candelina submexicana]